MVQLKTSRMDSTLAAGSGCIRDEVAIVLNRETLYRAAHQQDNKDFAKMNVWTKKR